MTLCGLFELGRVNQLISLAALLVGLRNTGDVTGLLVER